MNKIYKKYRNKNTGTKVKKWEQNPGTKISKN
jgi:hypothetical protein